MLPKFPVHAVQPNNQTPNFRLLRKLANLLLKIVILGLYQCCTFVENELSPTISPLCQIVIRRFGS